MAPKPTQAEIQALLARHGGELTEVETDELYVVAKRPTRDELAAFVNGGSTAPETAHNNLLCACVVWPPVADWQAAIERTPGLLPRFGQHVADSAYPGEVVHIGEKDAVPKEHGAKVAELRAKGCDLVLVVDGKIYGFKRPGRFEFEACTASLRADNHYDGPEAIATRCVVDPARDVFKEANQDLPGLALIAGLAVYALGRHKGKVRSGKLRASSP